MERNKLILFIFILPLIIWICISSMYPSSVQALRQATLTASPTFIPPSITPTYYSFACPVGTPLGYGTYTPSPLWLSTCGSCAALPTQTALPTFTQNPMTATAEYLTGTPTITPTTIPTHTATPMPFKEFVFTVEGWGIGGLGSPHNSSSWCSPVQGSTTHYLDCYGFFDGRVNAGSAVSYNIQLNAVDFPLTYYWDIQYDTVANQDAYCVLAGVPVDCQGSFYTETGHNFALGLVQDNTDSTGTNIPVTGNWSLVVSSSGSIGPTPTPTITPTALPDYGYCSSVAPTYAEFGFDLFQPDGEPNCSIGWDEVSIGDYTLPAVQICLQPSKFGVIRLFAMDFEVGIYGLGAAAAFFYRVFRTI